MSIACTVSQTRLEERNHWYASVGRLGGMIRCKRGRKYPLCLGSKVALQRSDEHQHLEKVELDVSPNTRMEKGVERYVQVLLKGHEPVGFEAENLCLITLNQYLISVAHSVASNGVRYCDGGCCRHPHLGAGGFSNSFNPGGFPIQRHSKLLRLSVINPV